MTGMNEACNATFHFFWFRNNSRYETLPRLCLNLAATSYHRIQ
jgi:hypothetical protein